MGKGLAIDARLSYDDYLQGDEMKLKATLVCSLLDLANIAAPEKLFEELQLADCAAELEQDSIFEFSGETYRTKHPSWDLELLSYMFNVKSRTILQARKQILKGVASQLFEFKNTDLSKNQKVLGTIVAPCLNCFK